jgi:hypothetical protein
MFRGIVASGCSRSHAVKGGIRAGFIASREHSRRDTGIVAGSSIGRGVVDVRVTIKKQRMGSKAEIMLAGFVVTKE